MEVSNSLYNPGNIGNPNLSNFSYLGNIGNLLFPISDEVEMRAAGGWLQGLGSGGAWIIFGTRFLEFVVILEILEILFLCIFVIYTKAHAEI